MIRWNMVATPENIIDVLAAHAAEGIMTRLQWMTLAPKSICVIGCYQEALSAKLKECYPEAEMNGEQPDLIIANLELPWQTDLDAVMKAWHAILQPPGLVMFTAFGPDTLREWPDQNTCLVNRIDMHDIGDTLVQAGLSDPVMEVENYTITYSDWEKMLRELVAGKLLHASVVPDEQMSAVNKWQLTCELVYGHAWKADNVSSTNKDGETVIPLSMLRAQLRRQDPSATE